MHNLIIRRMRPGDLASLDRQLGQRQYFADRLERQSGGLGVLLVAWQGDAPIGHVFLWLAPAEEPEIRTHLRDVPLITHLEVHPGHRGQKVGTRLLEAAERQLAAMGHHKVALAVEESNTAAARLYIRLGYASWPHEQVKCYSYPDEHGHRFVELCDVMEKPLAPEVPAAEAQPEVSHDRAEVVLATVPLPVRL
ncbi:GNAT family N-acetyltransferase [Lentzea sp. NPDC042327]|uniref:GNAT family N-acetyltransferase n=1 Tax=Lentzea sp. NPDC042327 TaxID=3154801 RepID=UPI0033E5CE59